MVGGFFFPSRIIMTSYPVTGNDCWTSLCETSTYGQPTKSQLLLYRQTTLKKSMMIAFFYTRKKFPSIRTDHPVVGPGVPSLVPLSGFLIVVGHQIGMPKLYWNGFLLEFLIERFENSIMWWTCVKFVRWKLVEKSSSSLRWIRSAFLTRHSLFLHRKEMESFSFWWMAPFSYSLVGKGGLIKRGSSHHAPHFTSPLHQSSRSKNRLYTHRLESSPTWRPIALIQDGKKERKN